MLDEIRSAVNAVRIEIADDAAVDQQHTRRLSTPSLLDDEEFDSLNRANGSGRVHYLKSGSNDFDASFCVCASHWSNPTNARGLLDNGVLPNWIQITGTFQAVPPGDYLVYWHLKNDHTLGLLSETDEGKWAVSARTYDLDVIDEMCSDCSFNKAYQCPSGRHLRLTHRDPSVTRPRDRHQWRRLALGIVEVRGNGPSSVSTSFGWNPRWPRSFSLCHAGLIKVSVSWDVKLMLLLGMDKRKQQQHDSVLVKLNADLLRTILSFVK
jgi:hypothetical protein